DNVAATNAGIYSVRVTVNACTSFEGTTTVVTNPIPATPAASNTGPYCVGQTISLSTPTVAGATYAWTGPNGFTSALQNPTITNRSEERRVGKNDTDTIGACTSIARTTTVVVNPLPT